MKRNSRPCKLAAPALCSMIAIALALTGCGGSRDSKNALSEEVIAPRPPGFLIGPASALLTNATAFSASVAIELPDDPTKKPALGGQLLGAGNRLIFSPLRGDRTFIWNAQERNGYVLSEALQGYAPFGSPVKITNVVTAAETAGPSSVRVNGHPGHEVEVTIAMDDGTTARFSIWRASDLNGFPVRVKTLSADKPYVLEITDVKAAKLAAALFMPPDGFTKYPTPEAMGGELLARKSQPKNTESKYFGETQPILKGATPGGPQ